MARFVLGLGIGPKSATVPVYAAECKQTYRHNKMSNVYDFSRCSPGHSWRVSYDVVGGKRLFASS